MHPVNYEGGRLPSRPLLNPPQSANKLNCDSIVASEKVVTDVEGERGK